MHSLRERLPADLLEAPRGLDLRAVPRRVDLGEAILSRHIQEPPMKYMLCRGNSLADVITKTCVLENVQGVESVEISLNREVLVSTELRHSLIREEIKKLEKDRVT
jgi:hypothetical protein